MVGVYYYYYYHYYYYLTKDEIVYSFNIIQWIESIC